MIALADASVALKWFHARDEPELHESRALIDAHIERRIDVQLVDLTLYEVANTVLRRHRWPSHLVHDVTSTLRASHRILIPTDGERGVAAKLSERHGLTFYDAAYAAVAATRGLVLVTADRQLLDGFGRSATEVAAEL